MTNTTRAIGIRSGGMYSIHLSANGAQCMLRIQKAKGFKHRANGLQMFEIIKSKNKIFDEMLSQFRPAVAKSNITFRR